jgi:nicotinamidase-related amidase
MALAFTAGETVTLPEIPFRPTVELPAAKTAIVVVDMQNDFVDRGGALSVATAAATVPAIQRLLAAGRAAGTHIAFVQDTHFPGDPEFEIWPEHTMNGAWGWQIVDALKPQPGEMIWQKNRYDAFYGTPMEHYLSHVWHVENLVLAGTVANICVLQTAGSAGLRWLNVVVPADGISALTEFDQALALRQISFLYNGNLVRCVDDIRLQAG